MKAFEGFLWAMASLLCFTISWGLGAWTTPLLVRLLFTSVGWILAGVAAAKIWMAAKKFD